MSDIILPTGNEHSIEESWLPDVETMLKLFRFHVRTVDNEWSYPEHEHMLFELNLVLEGEQHMNIEGSSFLQKEGDLLLIQPGDKHSSRVEQGKKMQYLCIHFDIDDPVFRQMLRTTNSMLLEADSSAVKRIRPSLERLGALSRMKNADSLPNRMKTLSAVFELFSEMGEVLYDEREEHRSGKFKQIHLAEQIASKIESEMERKDTAGCKDAAVDSHDVIQRIAEDLGYSTSHCHLVFKEVYGQSPRQYLSSLMLRKAKLLLLNHRLSIEQVAVRLGYRDLSLFSRQFKRWEGMSPSQYRKHAENVRV